MRVAVVSEKPYRAVSVAEVIARYRGERLGCRAYLQARRVLLPVAALERHLPASGRILDAPCGYGLLSIFAALAAPARELLGIDLAPERIETARRAARGLPNVSFETGDLARFAVRGLAAILIIDSLHYFPTAGQRSILDRSRAALAAGGTLVVRDAVREPTLRFAWNRLHERVMVGAALTATKEGGLHFVTLDELRRAIESAGFRVEMVERPRPWLPYTDALVVATAV